MTEDIKLPMLFKKTSTGADQSWEVSTEGSTIVTRFGQVGGKIQVATDTITVGKNPGKANATTPEQQARLEATSQWEKKLKKGYVQDLEAARAGKTDSVIEGGIFPMLAFSFEKQGHKLKYPLYGNPKLDGTRCIATIRAGVCTLWSRSRKKILSMPHIVKALETAFPTGEYIFDGELYSADLSNDFEQLIHLVRQVTPAPGHEKMQYWVYDMAIPEMPFCDRYQLLKDLLPAQYPFVLVEATELESETAAMEYFAGCQQQGFEGAILRNASGLYIGKRSPDLIKVKSFADAEFEVVDVEEGRGKLAGHVGAFVCKTESGAIFKAKLKGSLDYLKTLFEDRTLWEGKKLTVQYQNLTSDLIPRFPVGLALRDYE
jgi:DNA ligase-1